MHGQAVALPPMRTGFGIQALLGQAQPLDRPPRDQVLGDNLRRVLGLDMAVPDSIGIDHYSRSMLALVQAAGLVDAHLAGQPSGLGQLLQLCVQIAGSVGGAGRARRPLGPHVVADKDVALKCGQLESS